MGEPARLQQRTGAVCPPRPLRCDFLLAPAPNDNSRVRHDLVRGGWRSLGIGGLTVLALTGVSTSMHAGALPRAQPSPARAAPPAECGATPYECARSQVERGEYASAVRALEPWLRQTPRDLKGLNLLGLALTGAGRIDEANARFREALAIDASFYPAEKNLAINEFNQGRRTEAARRFERVLQRVPDDPIAHIHLGEIFFEQQDTRTALVHYQKGLARVAQNPSWQLHYAACLLASGDQRTALAILDALPSADAAILFEAGVTLGRAGAHADAARFFDRARRGHADPYAAGYNRTLMLVEAGDAAGAIQSAQALLNEGPKTGELYSLLSRAYVQAGRIVDAYDALREATRLEPTTESHYTDLAMICLDHENFDLGIEVIEIGLRALPDSGALHTQRGVLLMMKGLFEPAEQAFETAQRLSPASAIPAIALAMAWMQTGQNPRAVDLLRRRTLVDTKDPIVFHTLGLALMRSGVDPGDASGDEAVKAFATAVRLNPSYGAAHAELGKLLLKRGDVTGAVAELEKAVALEPNEVGPSYALAQAWRRLGQTARAEELLARVSRLNARERGDEPDRELKRAVLRIVREGAPTRPRSTP
jgi:tetratricopeptide (TPR) repeat protein